MVSIYELLSTICTPLTHCASTPAERRGCRVMLRQLHLIAEIRSRRSQMRPRPCVWGCHHQRRFPQGGLAWGGERAGLDFQIIFRHFGILNGMFRVSLWCRILISDKTTTKNRFQSQQIMEGSPGFICNKMIHPSEFHQNQTVGLLSFEILTFNKCPHEEHLSHVWMLEQRSISPPVSFRIILMASGKSLLTDGPISFLDYKNKNTAVTSFSLDNSDNVAHLQVHRLMNLHVNICQ